MYANNVNVLYKPFCDYCQRYLRTGGYMMDHISSNLYMRSDNEMNLYVQRLFYHLPHILTSNYAASVTNAPKKKKTHQSKTTLFRIYTYTATYFDSYWIIIRHSYRTRRPYKHTCTLQSSVTVGYKVWWSTCAVNKYDSYLYTLCTYAIGGNHFLNKLRLKHDNSILF